MSDFFSPCCKIGLAPMAGAGDSGFRRICREWGADYTVTEMISAKAVRYGAEKSALLARHTPAEEPVRVQLFGRDPVDISFAASYLSAHFRPAGIDINMGCPAPKIFNNREGSALLREPALAAELVRAAKKNCFCPVSVKMRIGIDSPDPGIIDFAREMECAGASFITVHGRTRAQFYSGKADYTMIANIKKALRIPVIANGDVTDGRSARQILDETGADGLMLARGALGAPYVFWQIKETLSGLPCRSFSLEERFAICLKHLFFTIEDKGEERACLEFRKHLLWYLKGIPGAAAYKVKAGQIRCKADCEALLHQIILAEKK